MPLLTLRRASLTLPSAVSRHPIGSGAFPDRFKNPSRGYRPAIDGLRSIAVISVILFHFDPRLVGGGFVGVDVFFVISGYLICSVLLADIHGQRFSIARFYQRRIARIFPAFATVLAVTLGSAAFVYSSQDFASLGANAAAAALSLINVKLLFQGNYFTLSEDAQPILHYWTLALEDQFHLLFPVYLYLITRLRRSLAVNLCVAGASFAACMLVTHFSPAAAFYLLPTRAWELLAGSSLALAEWHGLAGGRRNAAIAAWAGIALLVLSFLAIRHNAYFPGAIALLPVLGTVLVLSAASEGALLPIRLLSRPLPVFIGKLSYSLYLWHWAVFSLVDYRFFASGILIRTALKVVITLCASFLTYKFLEAPLRVRLSRSDFRLSVFAGAAAVVVFLCFAGMAVRNHYYLDCDPVRIASGGIAIDGGPAGSVVLAGDSQASMYGAELASLARQRGFTLNVVSVAGGDELPLLSPSYWPETLSFIVRRHPDVVILANAWSRKIGSDAAPLRMALQAMQGHVGHVIVLAQQPVVPAKASRRGIRDGAKPPFFEGRDAKARREATTDNLRRFASDWVTVRDVSPIFLDDQGRIRLIADNGRLTYEDTRQHLSDSGTAMVRPLLENAIESALGRCGAHC